MLELAEPMWPPFFGLHTGPWRHESHIKRPDTRPMKRCAEESQKIPLQSWGHPHTPRDCRRPFGLSYRSILIFRSGKRAIFVFAFAKSAKPVLSLSEGRT